MFKKLIGAQIVNVTDDCIEVKKGNQIFKLEIDSDYGDCCGYAEFETNMLYSPNDIKNPVITNVSKENKDSESGSEEISVITFFGESKPLATIEGTAGSGSGWGYGAFVSLRCKALDIDATLVSW